MSILGRGAARWSPAQQPCCRATTAVAIMAQPLAQLFYWLSLDTGDGTEEWIQTNYPRVVACALLAIGLFLASLCITVIFDLFGCSSSSSSTATTGHAVACASVCLAPWGAIFTLQDWGSSETGHGYWSWMGLCAGIAAGVLAMWPLLVICGGFRDAAPCSGSGGWAWGLRSSYDRTP